MEDLQHLTNQLDSTDEEVRRSAITGMAGFAFEDVRDLYFKAMGDESWRVRKESVDSLLMYPLSDQMVEMLVQMVRSEDNAGLRNSAVETLERLGSPVVPILRRYANDPDQDVRKFIIDILGHLRDASVVPLLIEALADPDSNVCAAAAENLGKIGDPRAVPHLLASLGNDNIWFRYTILEAFSRIGRPVPFAVLAPLAADTFLKKPLFDCLRAIGGAEAVPLLVEGLKEKSRSIREAAAMAILAIRERLTRSLVESEIHPHLRKLAGTATVGLLLGSLQSGEKGVKEAAIAMLGMIGDTSAVPELLQSCGDDRLRRHCLLAFNDIGDNGLATILEKFQEADDDVRTLILFICGEVGCTTCESQLRQGLNSPSPLLRKVAVAAVGRIGLVALLDDVALLLDDVEPEVRAGSVSVLARFGESDPGAVRAIASRLFVSSIPESRRHAAILYAALADGEKLSLLVKDEDPTVRTSAVDSLAGLRSPAAVGSLVMALADEEADVRIAATAALGTIGGPEALDPLLLALRDEDLWVRCAALKSLGRIGTPAAECAITEVFSTADGLVMVSALEALAEIGTEEAFSIIVTALDADDEDVVKAAITMLGKNGTGWLDTWWQKLLAHPNWDVRCCFARVMTAQWGTKALPYLQQAFADEADDLVKGQLAELIDRLH